LSDINADARGGQIMFISHCILNQNAKVRGIAVYPGAVKPVIELLLDAGVAIYQMPCPEMTYLGALRWGQVRDQYNSPMFRRYCQGLASQVLEQVVEYRRGGYKILGFIMVDGSPVCGLKKTPQSAVEGQVWGGMTRYVPTQHFVCGQGVFCEILRAEAERLGLADIPFVSTPEAPDAGSFEEALKSIGELIPGEDRR
jgi:predicted secreted protein